MAVDSVCRSIRQNTYDCLPERGQRFVKGSLFSLGGTFLGIGMRLLYATETCRFYGKIPNCGNDFMLTVTVHTVATAAIYSCYQGAKDSFQKAFA